MTNKPIFFIGFMGTGKTVTAKKIAGLLQRPFLDIDDLIETTSGKKIAELFELGESYFRDLETEIISSYNFDNAIVACGGGLPCFNSNIETINKLGTSIYLKTNRGILISRLIYNKSKRPLLAKMSDTDLIVFINELIDKREPYYKLAHIHFQLDKKKINDLIDIINTI